MDVISARKCELEPREPAIAVSMDVAESHESHEISPRGVIEMLSREPDTAMGVAGSGVSLLRAQTPDRES